MLCYWLVVMLLLLVTLYNYCYVFGLCNNTHYIIQITLAKKFIQFAVKTEERIYGTANQITTTG